MVEFPESIWEHCPHREYYRGHKTYGDDIPARAQGAYFPGDEPGWRCHLEHHHCPEQVEDFTDCPRMEALDDPCPADIGQYEPYEPCLEPLWRDNITGDIWCEECGIIGDIGEAGDEALERLKLQARD